MAGKQLSQLKGPQRDNLELCITWAGPFVPHHILVPATAKHLEGHCVLHYDAIRGSIHYDALVSTAMLIPHQMAHCSSRSRSPSTEPSITR